MKRFEQFDPYKESDADPYMVDKGNVVLEYYMLKEMVRTLSRAIESLRKGKPVVAFEDTQRVWNQLDDLQRRGIPIREVK